MPILLNLVKWILLIMCVCVFVITQVAEARVTSQQIDEARELYRPAAARASLLYFILNDLHKINPIYQFSLKVCITSSTFPV